MKLLSAPQGKSKRELDNSTQELRGLELDAMILKKQKELRLLDEQVLRILSESGKRNYEEEELWKEKISLLTGEVEALESRRRFALVPLEARVKEVEDRERVVSESEERLVLKESDLEYTKQLLEDRLDQVGERELSANDYTIRLNNREFAIQNQEMVVQKRMEAITVLLKEILAEEEEARKQASLRKAVLKGRDISITERERNVDMQEAAFANREKAILDKYQTLQRTITEVNLKK